MDEKFNPQPKTPDAKTPEYSFEEGANEAARRIQILLENLDRDIYVIINGSGIDVGKSYLLGNIYGKLMGLGITAYPTFFTEKRGEEKSVFINITQSKEYLRGFDYRSELLKNNPDAIGKDEDYADLYIGIYSPDKPFSLDTEYVPVADIMIRNDDAKEDLTKYSAQNKRK